MIGGGGGISPKMKKKSQIKIASAHIHFPMNNLAKFQNYLTDGLGGVADKGPQYIYVYQRNGLGRGDFP